jgi:hypothetical protein
MAISAGTVPVRGRSCENTTATARAEAITEGLVPQALATPRLLADQHSGFELAKESRLVGSIRPRK